MTEKRNECARVFILLHLSVGGIYTVIRSKAYVSTEEMGDQFCLIGPYKEQSARTEVEEADFPPHSPLHQAVQVLRDQGYKVSPTTDTTYLVSAFFRLDAKSAHHAGSRGASAVSRRCSIEDG